EPEAALVGVDLAERDEVVPREAATLDEPAEGRSQEVGVEHLVPRGTRRVRREDSRGAQPLDRLVRRQALLLDELAHPLELQERGGPLGPGEDRRVAPAA